MPIIEEVLGIKIDPRDKVDLPKYNPAVNPQEFKEKEAKRNEHAQVVSDAKAYFAELDPAQGEGMTEGEFRATVLTALKHLAEGLANTENLIYDNLGNPYKGNKV